MHINLPRDGLKKAYLRLYEVPLPERIRVQFSQRLNQIRTMIVADVQIENNKEIEFVEKPGEPIEKVD